MTISKDLKEIQKYTLVKSIAFDCVIVLLYYESKRAGYKIIGSTDNLSTAVNYDYFEA